MARYSRKHYQDVARILASAQHWRRPAAGATRSLQVGYVKLALHDITYKFRDLFAKDNQRFNGERFIRESNIQPLSDSSPIEKEVTT